MHLWNGHGLVKNHQGFSTFLWLEEPDVYRNKHTVKVVQRAWIKETTMSATQETNTDLLCKSPVFCQPHILLLQLDIWPSLCKLMCVCFYMHLLKGTTFHVLNFIRVYMWVYSSVTSQSVCKAIVVQHKTWGCGHMETSRMFQLNIVIMCRNNTFEIINVCIFTNSCVRVTQPQAAVSCVVALCFIIISSCHVSHSELSLFVLFIIICLHCSSLSSLTVNVL